MLERDRDKNPVVALREIAAKLIKPEDSKEDYIRSLQKHAEVDEPEEARPRPTTARIPRIARSPRKSCCAPSQRSQRRAEPQPEPEADYEE